MKMKNNKFSAFLLTLALLFGVLSATRITAYAQMFDPVTNITDVPTTATAGTPLALTGTVIPSNATNKTITWNVKDAGATGATISGNTLNTTAAGTAVVTATIPGGIPADSIKAISAGVLHTIALKTDGSLWAWGYNGVGELGDGTNVDRNTPVRIGSETNWSAISAGEFRTIALKTDGSIWAWGSNYNGELGNGTNSVRNTPAQIGSETNWSAISAGLYHTIALKTDGSLWAWGRNYEGQLGDGTDTDRNTPVRIGSETNWSAISAGYEHTTALKTDGSLWAWGSNTFGQLGDGTDTDRNTPVRIGSETNWSAISAGEFRTIALKTDGSLWAWGRNYEGQLGDGTYPYSTDPVQPIFPYIQDFNITVNKQTASAPDAPMAASVTTNSITLNTISGAEYRLSTGIWQDSPTFTGLSSNTGYTFYARIKETATHYASSESPASALIYTSIAVTPTYALNVSPGAGGTVSGTDSGSYAHGYYVNVTANPSSGYRFVNWTVSGATITGGNTANPAAFTMPSNAVTLTANFGIVSGSIIPVTNITGVPSTTTSRTPLTLTGTVNPTNATNKTITWSVRDAGMTGATISGNTLNTTTAGYVTVRATIANGLADGVNYTKDCYITVYAAPEPMLTEIRQLSIPGYNTSGIEIDDRGDGNFYATLFGNSDAITINSVEYSIHNVPAGAAIESEIEKDGAVTPLNIYRTATLSDSFISEDGVTFNNGDRGVYKLWLNDVLIGTFTVVYVNEAKAEQKDVVQAKVDGASYFAPVELPALAYSYRYEIVSRPNTVGGTAPRINADGQFVINQQAMPLNISRAGEYVVRAVDGYGNAADVYIITVY